MDKPDDLAKFDQMTAAMADTYPPMWRRFFESCVAQGFTEAQSLALVQTYIMSFCPFGVNAPRAN